MSAGNGNVGGVVGVLIGGGCEDANVRIDLDGTVHVREGVTLDAASRGFWSLIAQAVEAIQPFEVRRLRKQVEALRPHGTERQEPEAHTLGGFVRRWVRNHGLLDAGADYDGFVGESLVQLVDCFRAQGHSGASAEMVAQAFTAMLGDYQNPDAVEWAQYWQSPEGSVRRGMLEAEAERAKG
jgi:hypothetical protein